MSEKRYKPLKHLGHKLYAKYHDPSPRDSLDIYSQGSTGLQCISPKRGITLQQKVWLRKNMYNFKIPSLTVLDRIQSITDRRTGPNQYAPSILRSWGYYKVALFLLILLLFFFFFFLSHKQSTRVKNYSEVRRVCLDLMLMLRTIWVGSMVWTVWVYTLTLHC